MSDPGGPLPARRGERRGGGRRPHLVAGAGFAGAVRFAAGPVVLGALRPEARHAPGQDPDLAVGGLRRLLLELAAVPLPGVRGVMRRPVLVGLVGLGALALAPLPAPSGGD